MKEPGLALEFADEKRAYHPGERVRGTATWSLQTEAAALEVRLFWKTTGKGSSELEIVDSTRVARPALRGQAAFDLLLPPRPYSLNGRLISIVWAVELVVMPGDLAHTQAIDVGPDGGAIALPEHVEG